MSLTNKWKAKNKSLTSWLIAFRKRVRAALGENRQDEEEGEESQAAAPTKSSAALVSNAAGTGGHEHHDGDKSGEAGLDPHEAQQRPGHVNAYDGPREQRCRVW